MIATVKSAVIASGSSLTFVFGPFSPGDVFESFTLAFEGAGVGVDGNVIFRVSDGGLKEDAVEVMSGTHVLPLGVATVTMARWPVWQKIQAQRQAIKIEVLVKDTVAAVVVTVGVAVRPAFRLPTGKAGRGGSSVIVT